MQITTLKDCWMSSPLQKQWSWICSLDLIFMHVSSTGVAMDKMIIKVQGYNMIKTLSKDAWEWHDTSTTLVFPLSSANITFCHGSRSRKPDAVLMKQVPHMDTFQWTNFIFMMEIKYCDNSKLYSDMISYIGKLHILFWPIKSIDDTSWVWTYWVLISPSACTPMEDRALLSPLTSIRMSRSTCRLSLGSSTQIYFWVTICPSQKAWGRHRNEVAGSYDCISHLQQPIQHWMIYQGHGNFLHPPCAP